MRKMRSREEICKELKSFVDEHGMERRTYETMLHEANFELLLDIRQLLLTPIVAAEEKDKLEKKNKGLLWKYMSGELQ